MKVILGLMASFIMSTAWAQRSYDPDWETGRYDTGSGAGSTDSMNVSLPLARQGRRHMFEFNVDSPLRAAISFEKNKVKGSDSENETNAALSLNYAYGIHRLVQAGARLNYFSGVSGNEDVENMDISVGAILNSEEDFTRSMFAALYVGAGWAQQFGDEANRDDLRFMTLSVGKRMPLERFGIDHVTWTPEIAVKTLNSTTDASLDYSQSLELRILQFSVFF
jgi:hypothetical protein